MREKHNFSLGSFPEGSKAIDVEEERREKFRDYNGQYLLPEPIVLSLMKV